MKILEIREWNNFKDEAKLKAYYKYADTYWPYLKKIAEKNNIKLGGWTDGSGHMMMTLEYESAEDHLKVWSDDEFYSNWVKFCRHVKNACKRALRPPLGVPP